ncbi:prolyl oligopeptidase family serine peptidase [Luteimonas composti]|uniref:Prolyl oligopeptidase family serine peptidase n=1 Tax=Luteimonas composti TaxID=398257 RepID=A0ABT6MQG0_9GAMM|nr:prolyl oligopeptidase family serine peptidase [Luteimonas composti]MDH7452323.1 prolyl oligopeptidase family serine peptidase [Luteimonas composti]
MHRSIPLLSCLFLSAFAALAQAQPAQPLTLDRIMDDPDWIGPPVEQAWWSWDGRQAYYLLKRDGSGIRDIHVQDIAGGASQVVDGASRAGIDAAQPVLDPQRTRMAFVRNGDVFVRDLRNGALTQLTRTEATESSPRWSTDGALVWRSGHDWFRWSATDRAFTHAASPQAQDDPAAAPKPDLLRDEQLRLVETLRLERERREAQRTRETELRRADPTRAPAPVYLGKDVEIAATALSPDGRWLAVATERKSDDRGQGGKMPKYVTESGYEEFEDVRTRVGRNLPRAQSFWLVDMRDGSRRELSVAGLPGVGQDPLAALRKAAGKDALKGPRALRLEDPGAGMLWSADSRHLALMLHAVDNKDRWLATLRPEEATLQSRHRLTDPAWINWSFNEFGWMPDQRTLWFVSEESGYAHLYAVEAAGGRTRALTSGRWEVTQPALSPDGTRFLFTCNRSRPGDYELCAVPAAGGEVAELTDLGGVEDFVASPDGARVLLRHSSSYLPPQLAVIDAGGGNLRTLTDTRKPEYRAIDFLQPETVQVPSRHGAGTIWGKYYGPATMEPGRKYPVVLFVHGAGYLQNVSDRYPNYFREQMFHNLLVQRGYIVLDLDYRASEGYGRDWRTAIYRQMGHPELEDYLDGIEWLVEHRQADRDRVGIYGGSYGGFMSFMALFREPGTFKAGAALRPVTDWSQYNHTYTANILNTPDIDPEAYRKSSPIEYAEGLQDHLLIAHGMIDDNVFYRDSVVLAQRLIELRKDKWEMASYPMERHGYVHADSWYDQYRRILELFERALK